jgi:uncharacterized protein (DUF1684 family)
MSDLEQFRKQKDQFFGSDPHSPLSAAQKRAFKGLSYYAENPALRFDVTVEPFAEQKHIRMQTSTGDVQDYVRHGTFRFKVDGQPAELTVYTSEGEGPFVPFVDATSGDETYGAGRYLELEHLGGERFHVDFNLAYNPWCAYSPHYSCPLPPWENRLEVPIRAGEKDFQNPDGHSPDH